MSAADELIARLRARAADPERRVDVRPSQFMAGVSTLDLGGLMGMLGSVSSDLRRVVAANQAGTPVDPDLHAKAVSIGASMSTPVATALPAVASAEALAALEAAIGCRSRRSCGGSTPRSPTVGSGRVAGCSARTGRPRRTGGCAKAPSCPAGDRGRRRCCRSSSATRASLRRLFVARRPGRRLGSRGARRVLGREGVREVVQREAPSVEAWLEPVGRQQDPGGAAGRDDAGRDGQGAGPVAGLLAGHDAGAAGVIRPERRRDAPADGRGRRGPSDVARAEARCPQSKFQPPDD